MRLGGHAKLVVEASSTDDVVEACHYAREQGLPLFVLGGGSNTIARDEGFDGLVLHNQIPGYEILENTDNSVTIRVGAGENWDETVARTVESGLTGIEALSKIPGTVGAAPVQNIGAYGQEVSNVITAVEVYDTETDSITTLEPKDCDFGYRDSIFRNAHNGRYVILSVTMQLAKGNPPAPYYRAVEDYLTTHSAPVVTPAVIRSAVSTIRAGKLPDPTTRPNTGSFFKNAVVSQNIFSRIKSTHPDVPSYPAKDGLVKLPTGWLIEQTGLKGKLLHGMRIHDQNALVLINESASGYQDLAAARTEVVAAVNRQFGITIAQEPLELTANP
jgi:UDP-N-acetylmuramate dehydrogenase